MSTWHDLTDYFQTDLDGQISEMRRKYENTYLIIISEGKEYIVLYRGYKDGYHRFEDEFKSLIRLKHNTEIEVLSPWPDTGLFSFNDDLHYFTKIPQRQYRRGICGDNASIIRPAECLFSHANRLHHESIQSALHPKFFEVTKLVELLEKDATFLGGALSREFGLTKPVEKDVAHLNLWYMDFIIGCFKNGVFYCTNKVFNQEVIDNCQLFHPYKVEINAD